MLIDLGKQFSFFKAPMQAETSGDIQIIQDKVLGKRVVKISGSVSQNNYMALKINQNSNYFYIQAMIPFEKIFTFVFEVQIQKKNQKLIMSNLYKKIKNQDNMLLVPIIPQYDKYMTFELNLRDYLQTFETIFVSKVKICANIFLRNIFLSDEEITINSCPKDMMFLKNVFFSFNQEKQKENVSLQENLSQKPVKSILKNKIKPEIPLKQVVEEKELSEEEEDQPQQQAPKPIQMNKDKIFQFSSNLMNIYYIIGFSCQSLSIYDENHFIFHVEKSLIVQNISNSNQFFYFSKNKIGNVKNLEQLIAVQTTQEVVFLQNLKEIGNFPSKEIFDEVTCMDIALEKKQVHLALSGIDYNKKETLILFDGQKISVRHQFQETIIQIEFINKYDYTKGVYLVFHQKIIIVQKDPITVVEVKDDIFKNVSIDENLGHACGIQGLLYIFDQKLIQKIKISESGIKCLAHTADHQLCFSNEDNKIFIFSQDCSLCQFEGKLESPPLFILAIRDNLLLGCQNQSIAYLQPEKKKIKYIMRNSKESTAGADLCQDQYLVLINGFTIKIYQHKEQIYEFRSHEEQVTSIKSFHLRPYILCGYDNGVVRLFSLKDFILLKEIQFTKSQILNIEINKNDESALITFEDKIQLIEKFEIIKTFEKAKHAKFYDKYIVIGNSEFVQLYDLEKKTLGKQIYIQYDFFQILNNELFVVDQKSIKIYTLPQIQLIRELMNLFEDQIKILQVTDGFVFGVSMQGNIKIWDGQFRGIIQILGNMCFQEYSNGEPLSHLIISNQFFVFTIGMSGSIYIWNFAELLTQQTIIEEFAEKNEDVVQLEPKEQIQEEKFVNTQKLQPEQIIIENEFLNDINFENIQQTEVQQENQEYFLKLVSQNGINQQRSQLKWHQIDDFYCYIIQDYLIIQLDEQQKIIRQLQQIRLNIVPKLLRLSEKWILLQAEKSIQLYSVGNFLFYKQITVQDQNILFSDLSFCNNQCLVIFEKKESIFIQIYETLTINVIATSLIKQKQNIIQVYKLIKAQYGNNTEIIILFSKFFQFWRLNQKKSLEYLQVEQIAQVKDQNYLCFDLHKDYLLIGTDEGNLLVYDSRSASLLCILEKMFPTIKQIVLTENYLFISNNQPHLYYFQIQNWELNPFINSLDDQFQQKLVSDSPIQSISSKDNQVIFTSKLGSVYLGDLQQQLVIKLQGSHYKEINLLKIQDSHIITVGSDFTCKIFENQEIISEIYLPKRTVLSMEVINKDVLLGQNDGKIRIFNFEDNKVFEQFQDLGNVTLSDSPITCIQKINASFILCGNMAGKLFALQISQNYKVDIVEINTFDFPCTKILCQGDYFLLILQNGKFLTHQRKNVKNQTLENLEQMDYYLVDGYRLGSIHSSDSIFDAQFTRDKFVYICLTNNEKQLIFRNFYDHTNIKTIEIDFFPICITLSNKYIFVSSNKGQIETIDLNMNKIQDLINCSTLPVRKIDCFEKSLVSVSGNIIQYWEFN